MNSPLDLFRLDGRVALITGGGGGLGTVFAHALAAAGADIALLGRRQEVVQAAANELKAETGRTTLALSADVTDPDAVRVAVDRVREEFGSLDILINNAGNNIRRPSLEYPLDDWMNVLNVNLTGAFICAQAVAPGMIANGWGRIINISSMLGLVGLEQRPAYTAAKGGLIQLTRTLGVEWAPYNVLVNALAPGPFETELNRPLIENPIAYRAFADKIPLDRWGRTDELMGPIVFLASEASSFMTGSVVTVDGGWTAQ
jgi:NAD(P)-dependent dehydrogenase (short-subunit alcohol dehydrogenase family)